MKTNESNRAFSSKLDTEMLELLLRSEGRIRSIELSARLGVPLSTIQRRRKRMEDICLVRSYSLNYSTFGLRQVELLISTEGGTTMAIGKELLKRNSVLFASRTIGEHTIDLKIGALVRTNGEILDHLEEVKGMSGVKDAMWTETVETIRRGNENYDCYDSILVPVTMQ